MRRQGQNCCSYWDHHNWMWLDPFPGCSSSSANREGTAGILVRLLVMPVVADTVATLDHTPWGPAVFNPWHFCLDPHRGPSARLLVTALA